MWTKYAYNRKHSNILLFLVENLTYYRVKMLQALRQLVTASTALGAGLRGVRLGDVDNKVWESNFL